MPYSKEWRLLMKRILEKKGEENLVILEDFIDEITKKVSPKEMWEQYQKKCENKNFKIKISK
jgi:hypothetical protein